MAVLPEANTVERPTAAAATLWREPVRRRLVRLCAALSCDPAAAEDLAQETLLEAWRNLHKLRDPAGAEAWLAAIARNVCRRWARRRGRDVANLTRVDAQVEAPDDLDVGEELERAELVELIDRALARMPAETREILVLRYADESPHAEIGARLGLTDDAVSMRLSRGKVVLRRLLASQLADEAAAYSLDGADDGWRATRVWCPGCGQRRLLVRREPPPGVVSFRCPGCGPDGLAAEYPLGNPFFARLVGGLVRPTAILARAAEWSSAYFSAGADANGVACTRCGRSVVLRRYCRDRDGRRGDGLFAHCGACGEQVSSSIRGTSLGLAAVRDFRRAHQRTRALVDADVEFAGVPAILARYEDVLGSAGVNVFYARETLRMLHVATD